MREEAMAKVSGLLFVCIVGLVIVPHLGLSRGLEVSLTVGLGAVAMGCAIAVTRAKRTKPAPPLPTPSEGLTSVTPSTEVSLVQEHDTPPPPVLQLRSKRGVRVPRRKPRPARDEQEALQRLAHAQRELERSRAACEQERIALRQQEILERNLIARLRNASALIYGYAEMLDKGDLGELAASQQFPILIIRRRARQLMTVIEDLETLLEAAEPNLSRGEVDLMKLVEDTLLAFEPECRAARLTLHKDIMFNMPHVQGNAAHLKRVLENLLDNARKFTPEGGAITVRLTQEGKEAVLQVKDTGIGIPAEALERIFERFYQVADRNVKQSGSGLGLALVKEVVQAHGGKVEVESTVGHGTTFTVRLPLHK